MQHKIQILTRHWNIFFYKSLRSLIPTNRKLYWCWCCIATKLHNYINAWLTFPCFWSMLPLYRIHVQNNVSSWVCMRELGQVQCHQEKADISRYVFIQRAKKKRRRKFVIKMNFGMFKTLWNFWEFWIYLSNEWYKKEPIWKLSLKSLWRSLTNTIKN